MASSLVEIVAFSNIEYLYTDYKLTEFEEEILSLERTYAEKYFYSEEQCFASLCMHYHITEIRMERILSIISRKLLSEEFYSS